MFTFSLEYIVYISDLVSAILFFLMCGEYVSKCTGYCCLAQNSPTSVFFKCVMSVFTCAQDIATYSCVLYLHQYLLV